MAKILLVEDDNNLREIYEARLMAEGYEIVSARDGEEALAVAMKEKPDLVISDVMMPKISGFDMLDILRTTEETKNVKIIMMTALSQAEDKERAEKLGADRYLVKSQVTLEDVAKVAKDVLEGGSSSETPAAPAPVDSNSATTPAPTDAPSGLVEPVTNPNEEKAIAQQIESMMAQSTPAPSDAAAPLAPTDPVTVVSEPAAAASIATSDDETPFAASTTVPEPPVATEPASMPMPVVDPAAPSTTTDTAEETQPRRDVMEEITRKVIQPINDMSSDNAAKLDALAAAEEQNAPVVPAPEPAAMVTPSVVPAPEPTAPVIDEPSTEVASAPASTDTPSMPSPAPTNQAPETPAQPVVDPNSIAL